MANIIVAVILIVILLAAIRYIVKQKKQEVKCIGCPAAGGCGKKDTQCNCNSHSESKG